MASIRKEFDLAASPDTVWAAFKDIGAVHTRLARGFVTDCRMDGKDRIVTFVNGLVAREVIVDLDDRAQKHFIKSADMLHLMVERFEVDLVEGIFLQRMIAAITADQVRAAARGKAVQRNGDDVRVEGRKLTVSIATALPRR